MQYGESTVAMGNKMSQDARSAEDFARQFTIDHAPVGLVTSEYRIIRWCNQTFAEMFQYRQADLIGQSFALLYPSTEEFEQIRDVGVQLLRETGKYWDERIMARRDGELFWCRVRVHVEDITDPLKRVVLSYSDISDHRRSVELTARERQVVSLLASGCTTKEIAFRLGLSPRTIDMHRGRLLKKFGVNNVIELLAHIVGDPILRV